ncbi:AMP-binding protein [Oceanisphaera psychrotolerans]|uniref:Acyl-CoA synthetase n=1 Tax=Oceanisphaera psychrotolerans TaxID=1414654 RepID=A0A1J4QDX3_9GAMM|nr:AMP-binding protein [Oceanisphaera psychrotolerans]OIN10439.1 acyl-CoA synthetase [Oceanisphaera psychrotolerans]
MLYVNEQFFDQAYFDAAAREFAALPALADCQNHRYAVCLPATAEWLALFFFLRDAGSSVLPLHPDMPLEAARRLARRAGCHWLFHHGQAPEALSSNMAAVPGGELLQMSSGTTGEPKCIARSWVSIERELDSYVGHFREPESMTAVIACPVTHSYGLIAGLLVALRRGQVPVIIDNLNPKYLLRRLRDIPRPLLYSSPAMLNTLCRLLPAGERLHAVMTSGTVLPGPWFQTLSAGTEHLFQQYGCSEAGCIAINPAVKAATDIGFVLPHLKLTAAPTGEAPAELVFAGEDGVIHTRDLGYRRADGMLVFVARLDDTINVAGLNLYPQEVEDVVMAMAGIRDAVVLRRQDPFAGERACLLFTADVPVSTATLRDWCRARLAAYQIPAEMVQVADIARQANGKISRREVAARFDAGELAPVAGEVA